MHKRTSLLIHYKQIEMEYNFKVETIEAGQRAKYGDSYYHFVVENLSKTNFADHIVKQFCTKFLRPTKFNESERRVALQESKDFGLNFAAYYTKFEKIADRKFIYKVVEPSTH